MSRWGLGQFDSLKDDISAALDRLLGPLRTSENDLLDHWPRKWIYDARFLFLDGTDSLRYRPSVRWLTLLTLTVSTIFILDRLFANFSSTKRRLGLPALVMEKGWDYAKVLEEGSKKYPNSPYIIKYTGYEYVVFPSSSFDEVKRLNASRASMIDWFTTVFWQGWHFLGTDNSSRYHTVGVDLARALPSRVWMRQENARAAFDTVLGSPATNRDWKDVSLWKTVQKLVALMNAMALFGPDIGGDPRWLKATERLHHAIMFGIIGSHLTPRLIRPLVAPVMFVPAKIVDWHMASLLRPMVQRELVKYRSTTQVEEHSSNGSDYSVSMLSHDVSNIDQAQKQTATKFPLTKWLLDRYDSRNDSLNHLLRDHIVIAFEAATSSAAILYFLLAELAERPELAQELREEVLGTTDDKGQLPLGYLSELRKMDSFMLELARKTGSSHLALFRRVQKPLQLSIGPDLAPGTLICVDAYHITKPQAKNDDATVLDPMRFYKMRQQPGHEELHQFTSPWPDNTIWGGGTQACPGRSFASVTIKVVLAHLLVNYDLQLLADGTKRPQRNAMPNGSVSPKTSARIMIRGR